MINKRLELYIHIPFCAHKCAYCDFLSGAADADTKEQYIQALVEEIKEAGTRYRGYLVPTIYIGGGTPSILPAQSIKRILDAVRSFFMVSESAEISMECNPGTVTYEKLLLYRQYGINRLSMGLQSASNEQLYDLGRIHTFEQFLENYGYARRAGFTNLNVDLMSALPGQTVETFTDSLKKVIMLKPEHISVYTLIVEEGTPFYERYEDDVLRREKGEATRFLPGEEEEYAIYKGTQQMLKQAGYEQYEISNFARPGYQCRHNIGYWQRENYLGLGLGAASMVENVRFSQTRSLKEYLDRWLRPKTCGMLEYASVEQVTRKGAMEEFMFLGLRMTAGVSREKFEKEFGTTLEAVYGQTLNGLASEGLVERKAGYVSLSDRGMDISNYVMEQFLLE